MATKPKPSGDQKVAHYGLYRAELSCKIGRDGLEEKESIRRIELQPIEWAMFNLLHAVEEIAKALTEIVQAQKLDMPRDK